MPPNRINTGCQAMAIVFTPKQGWTCFFQKKGAGLKSVRTRPVRTLKTAFWTLKTAFWTRPPVGYTCQNKKKAQAIFRVLIV